MQAGLVGFSGSGKTTLFQLITGVTPDPGKSHSGQLGIATLLDTRLDFLAQMHQPKKITPATVEILDTPGLIQGSHGENPQRLAIIREGDALLIVIRGFDDSNPLVELSNFRDELLFADLEVVSNRVTRLEASVKKPRPDREALEHELNLARKLRDTLEANSPIATLDLTRDDKKLFRSFGLLTDKAQVVVLNGPLETEVPPAFSAAVPDFILIDAKLELELAGLSPEERVDFMADLGIQELGADRIIRKAYDAVGIITFFTAGQPEVRGWNLERGESAVSAAGKIHTDLARGFIRAEVTAYDDLHRVGSMKEAKAQNLQRLEGKDYIVKDGDIMYFRSST